MTNNTKEQILNYMSNLTENFDFTQIAHFTAKSISDEMHISRSLASQYLNELVKEKIVLKINSRPVYFLHRRKMEEIYKITFRQDDFYDLEEVKQYVVDHSSGDGDYSSIIGYDKSLAGIIKQLRESFEYPPSGLPTIIYGGKGTGKRTLGTRIFENAARQGKINENTKLFKLEFSSQNSDNIEKQVFGTQGIIDKYDNIVFMFANAQYMSNSFQEKLCKFIEMDKNLSIDKVKYKNKVVRYMILSDTNPHLTMNERLLKNTPVIISLPSLSEKSNEEKEELIIHYIQNEGKKMNRHIKISNVVLRALCNGDYTNNLIGLQSAIQIMCASALRESRSRHEITIHAYHLPEYLLRTMPIVADEDIVYIDAFAYQKSEQIDFILDYFTRILRPFTIGDDFDEQLKESKHHYDLLSDYLSFKQRVPPERIKGIEISLNNILEVVLKRRYINLPSGFSCTLAKILYINDLYSDSVQKWQTESRSLLDDIINKLKINCLNETLIVEDISRLMNSNLEQETSDLLSILMTINVHHYNRSVSNRKIFGIIVCHGYSTATSIADAVNSLLENYIFDAVDMPLDITIDEIKEILVERLNRMHNNADVIVMVDMGSLEQLGNSLSTAINCNVGVINNVSTRLALNVGNAIINEKDVESTLKKVSENSQASYTIINRKKNDSILFVSESGIHMAQRMRELFENSLPKSIPVDFVVCDFNQLLASGEHNQVFDTNNVLFITGTANPYIQGYSFVALEDIISGNNIYVITQGLSKYFQADELNQLIEELRKNFTLQNVVGYLTILNPKTLLDNVSEAVDILQDYLHTRFGGKTLIGIYIHVCCLIERLVTKTPITVFDGLENFEKENTQFIQYVHDSFQTVSKRYNVEIPTSEIAYLYDFIKADQSDNDI